MRAAFALVSIACIAGLALLLTGAFQNHTSTFKYASPHSITPPSAGGGGERELNIVVMALPENATTYDRMFDTLDKNKDGFLDENEVNSKRLNWDVDPVVKDADINRDGRISKEEFRSAKTSKKPTKPTPKPPSSAAEKKKKKKEKMEKNRSRGKKDRGPPYPTYPPPHSPKEAPTPIKFSESIMARKRIHYVFTVDNRDVRGKGYRPFVAAANQAWATLLPKRSDEKHVYMYLRSNISCALKDCPTFPGKQVNKFCCSGPVYDPKIPGAIGEVVGKPTPVHPSWMDLKGILYMLDNVMEEGDFATYLDSDAHFDPNKNKTFYEAYEKMMPKFFSGEKPIGVVRDRSHWTAVCHQDFGGPYTHDVNSGIIMFTKNKNSREFFERLWISAMTASPQDKRKGQPLYYQFGWPHEQERLSWFGSTPVEASLISYIQRQGWHKELPWCFQVICHRNFDKMPYIEEYVKTSILSSGNCSLPEFRPHCKGGKVDPEKYDTLIESLLDAVKVLPI